MSERAVLYARVSTEVQVAGYSLATQLESCRQYAHQRGYAVVGEYTDHISGEVLRRPHLRRLTDQVYFEAIPVVVVHDLDRFTRNPAHLAILEMELERAGARIEFVMGDYADSAEGQLSKAIKAAIAQYENRQRRERFQRGRRGRVASGRVRLFGKRAAYGYAYVRDSGEYTVVEDEAIIVRWLFDQMAAGVGPHTLAANLTMAGQRTPSGANVAWQPTTIYNILRTPLYCGIYTEHIDGVRYTAAVPPIVDADVWAAVQRRLDAPRARATARPFLLTGFLQCACGNAWIGRTRSATSSYYRCSSISQRLLREACPMLGAIRADRLEEAVWSALTALLQQPAWLEVALAQRQADVAAARAAHDARIGVVAAALSALDRREGALLDALLDGRLSAGGVADAKTVLAAERTRLTAELAACQAVALPVAPALDQATIQGYVTHGLEALDYAQRRQLLTLLAVRLIVEDQTRVQLALLDGLVTQTLAVDPLVRSLPSKPRPAYRPRKEIMP